MRRLLPLLVLLLMVACDPYAYPKPERKVTTSNSTYTVEKLFDSPEGCHVYRFEDLGYMHYFTVCPSGATSTSSPRLVGKVTRVERIDATPVP